jgi:soluble lytic murein transglycosylase
MRRHIRITMFVASFVVLLGTAFVCLSFEGACANGGTEGNTLIDRIVSYLMGKHVGMKEDKLKAVVRTVCDESQKRDLDYRLALAVIKVESNFRQDVVSKKGASGLFQIVPCLARHIAKDAGVKCDGARCLHKPDANIKLGVYHLSKLVEDFKSLSTALHAYNVGTERARSRAPDSDEPKTPFTNRVLKEYKRNCSRLPDWDESDETPEVE